MKPSSLKGNLLALAALYLGSLVVASGCPAKQETADPPAAVPAAIKAPATPVDAQVAATPRRDDPLPSRGPTLDPPANEPAEKVPAEKEPAGENLVAKKEPFNPIKINGKFFEGWTKPQLALLISGRQDGYMEPCGCAGLENQKGGLGRRHDLIQELEQQGWPLAAVDVGGIVRRFGKQAEMQFGATAGALRTMGYDAVGFGPADLRLATGEIAVPIAGDQKSPPLFVSANVDIYGFVGKFRMVEVGGLKLGITSALGETARKEINNGDIGLSPAEAAIEAVLPELASCDHRILLANATLDESKALAKRFPEFDVVVTAGGFAEPPFTAEQIGKTQFIDVGEKGMFVIVLGFYPGEPKPRYQRVALDSRYQTTSEMKQVMVELQDQYQNIGLDGLGARVRPHPHTKAGDPLSGKFVGSASCKECHEDAYEIWSKSKHAHATDSLLHADPPRQFDPECLSCHVTGWNPQEFHPYVSGYLGLERTPQLVSNGCENCHGPGAAHVAAEKGADSGRQDEIRKLMHLVWDAKDTAKCVVCHDHDNSPEFKGEAIEKKYWRDIAH